jgi:hypothetical protein
MAQIFSDITALVQTEFPRFKLKIDETWNSTVRNHRSHIRSNLCDSLAAAGESDLQQWLDLKNRPMPKAHNVSISHCPVAGGFAQIPKPHKVGLDLEDLSRDITSVVSRISTADELKVAPSAAALWVAKESVLKAIGLTLVSEARVNSWKTLGNSSWTFSNGETGIGYVKKNSRLIMGLFILPA